MMATVGRFDFGVFASAGSAMIAINARKLVTNPARRNIPFFILFILPTVVSCPDSACVDEGRAVSFQLETLMHGAWLFQ
jgi:hypothetical protein